MLRETGDQSERQSTSGSTITRREGRVCGIAKDVAGTVRVSPSATEVLRDTEGDVVSGVDDKEETYTH